MNRFKQTHHTVEFKRKLSLCFFLLWFIAVKQLRHLLSRSDINI